MAVGYLIALCALPPALMAASHVYGNLAQDRTATVIVQVQTPAEIGLVVAAHEMRYQVKVLQSWDSATAKGYRATATVKRISKIEADQDVLSVDRIDEV